MAAARLRRPAAGRSRARFSGTRHHMRFSIGRCPLIHRILENVPDGLSRPDALSRRHQFTGALKATTDFPQAAAFPSDPRENVPDDVCLFWNRLKPGLPLAVVNGDVAIPVRCVGHDVERPALSGMLLAPPATLHDLGSLVLRDDALYLKQQVVLRALPQ